MGKRAMLYLGILVFAFALLLLVSSSNASAADHYVTGPVSGTWHTGDNVYVTGDVVVNATSSLTIQNGTNVYFDSGTSLTVNGQLIAVSNLVNRPINFTANATSPSAGYWDGIIFNGAMSPASSISGAHIEYATTGVDITDSVVTLNHILFNDISGSAINVVRDNTVAPDLAMTLDSLTIFNAGNGIVISGVDRNLTVGVSNSDFTNVDGNAVDVSTSGLGKVTIVVSDSSFTNIVDDAVSVVTALRAADVTVTGVTISNAYYGVYVRANSAGIVLVVDGLTADGISIAGVQAWCDGLNDITLSNISLNNTGIEGLGFQSWTNDIVTTVDNCELTNISNNAGIVFNSFYGGVNAVFTDVGVSGSMGVAGIWISANHTATVTLDGVEVAGAVTGVYVANGVSTPDQIALTMTDVFLDPPAYGVYLVGGAIDFSATQLIINDTATGIYALANGANVGTGACSISLEESTITNTTVGIDMTSINGLANLDLVNVLISGPNLNQGIIMAAENANAVVDISNVTIEMNPSIGVFSDPTYDGINVMANLSIEFTANNLTVIGGYDGVSVDSVNGAIEADLIMTDIEEVGGSGLLFYSQFDFVSLSLTDSSILGCGLDGVVAQGVTDVNLEFDSVIVNDTVDGVFALSTDGNVTADVTDSSVTNSSTGIRILAPNGWILMVLDPSVVRYADTGIYLDAMGEVDLSIYNSFVGNATIGIEIHSFDGGINVLFDSVVLGSTDLYGLFADADNSDITVSSTNNTVMDANNVGWYLVTSNGSVSIDVATTSFEFGETGILVESSNDLDANVVDSSFLGQEVLGMDLNASANITLNVGNSIFDGQIAENAQLFYPSMSEGQYKIIQPEAGNWTTDQSMTATLPFGFAFNGVTYTELNMSLNGWLAFGSDGAPDASSVYSFGPESPNLIAPAQEIWSANDPAMDGYFHGMGYKYDGDLNAVIFQWFVWDASQPQLTNVFEVILYANGGVEFRYAMMDGVITEASLLSNNDFGINMYNGPNWNLEILGLNALDMDFQSVFFTTEMFSNGAAIFAIAGGNMVATIDSSSFSHYLGGGVLLVAEEGSSSIDLQGSEFSFIYATSQVMGAFVAAALDNVMTATVTDCSFDTIATAAVVLFDAPSLGGVDSFVVEMNHFNQVIMTSAIVSVISDAEQNVTADYTSDKTFAQNDGTHVGIMAIATVVMADDVAWSIQETDVIENNNFTGEIDPWLLSSMTGLTVPYLGDISIDMNLGMLNDILVFESNISGNQIVHTASVAGNILSEGPVDQFFELGQPTIGAATILEMVTLDGASLVGQTDVSVTDNVITSHYAPLASGVNVIVAESLANPVDGMLDSTVSVNFVNNTLDSWYGGGNGLGLAVMQALNDGNGAGLLNVDVTATDNMISGFGNGISVAVNASASNLFGDVVSNVDTLIRDNEIYTYADGIDVYLETGAVFAHYFPPYEQVVDSNATMAIDVEVINNTVQAGYEGIYVETDVAATEDAYGVFTNAYASITGPVNVLDNRVDVYWDGYGIDVESYVSAAVSMATAMSDVPVTIVNNTINADWYGTGIYVANGASASTLDLRFYDQPNALMLVNLNVTGNSIYGNSGIVIDQSSDATGGMSQASVMAKVMVTDNMLTGISDLGISVDAIAASHNIDYYPWAAVNADVVITNNNVSGYGGTGIEVTVQPGDENVWYVDLSGTVMIVNNTVTGTDVGISADVVVQLDIVQNVVSEVQDGIDATANGMNILENTITGVTGNGMWLSGSGMVENNTIEGAGSAETNEAEGIFIEDAGSMTIQGNTIRNVGSDGIHAVYLYDVLITNNTFENIGASGVYLYGESTSYYLTVSNNTLTNLGDSGVEVNNINWLYVLNNEMTNVSYYGVEANGASNVFIENNTMSMMYGGVDLTDITNANIMNNVMSAQPTSDGYGIDVDSATLVVVKGNEVTGFGQGVEFDYVYDLVFTWNMVTGSLGDGAYFYVDTATIANNVFSGSAYMGVVIEDSDTVTFANNEVKNNGLDGLLVINTYALTIVNGMFADNGEFGIEVNDSFVTWNVDAASSVERNDVLFYGDLTVMSGGSLVLNGVDFIVISGSMGEQSVIMVLEGGALTTVDAQFELAVLGGLDASIYGDFYLFDVYGRLAMSNTEVSGALELLLGATSNATIEMSTITENVRNGIHIVDCAPVIRSCTIASNPRNGIFVEGSSAAPVITDCLIVDNNRGIYAVNATLEQVTDNVIALNTEAGIFAEKMTGRIHDNLLLLNHIEIYVRNSNVSIQDNQIGYTQLIQVIAQYVPLLQGFDMNSDIFLPALGMSFSPGMIQGIIVGHVGLYAVDSTVRSSGNQFGMLSTAVHVVNTDLTFGDDIRQNTIILPYMDASNIVRNMSLPVPVYDGIVATNSHVVMNGGSIDVLDDAVFLDNSTATIGSTTLKAMDFSIYAIDGSTVTVTDSTFGKVKVEDTSMLDVWEKLTVVVKDPWGAVLANVPVTVGEVSRTTDSNGMTVVYIEAYVMDSSGKVPANPYLVSANLTDVPMTSYPGHASWVTPIVSEHVTANGPTTVTLVSGVVIRFDLIAHTMDKDGKNAVNVTVMVFDAAGTLVTQAQSDANGTAAFELVSYIKNADGTTDNSMTPYKVSADIGGTTVQASTNLTDNTNLDLKVVVTEFNWGPAIIMGAVALVMILAAIFLLTRKK